MSGGEIGCTTSHLKAMKRFLDTSDSPYAVMMEDDCSLRSSSVTGTFTLERVSYTSFSI